MYSSTLRISKSALLHNLNAIKNHKNPQNKLLAVVKADAYGHGAVQIAHWLAPYVDGFCVARLHEAIELRNAGIQHKILVFTPPRVDTAAHYITHDVIASVGSFLDMDLLPSNTRIHLNMDTGMGRLGFIDDKESPDLSAIVAYAKQKNLRLEGAYTHFSDAEKPSSSLTQHQIKRWKGVELWFRQHIDPEFLLHVANSAAAANLGESRTLPLRTGLSLYGYVDGFSFDVPLKPLFQWYAPLVAVREVPKGWKISYAGHWQAPNQGYVGVLAVGYADGVVRSLGGKIHLGHQTSQKLYPQVGRVTMDHIMIWLDQDKLKEGELFDILNGCGMQVEQWADLLQTIPYEITTNIGSRVLREYVD